MSEEKISDEELEESIRWCRSVAYGNWIDKTKITNIPWYQKFIALTELKEHRDREKR